MLPVILDVSALKLCVVGSGPQAQRRLQMLDEAGAQFVRVYCDEIVAEMDDIAGDRMIHRLPTRQEIADCHVMYVANLSDIEGKTLIKADILEWEVTSNGVAGTTQEKANVRAEIARYFAFCSCLGGVLPGNGSGSAGHTSLIRS